MEYLLLLFLQYDSVDFPVFTVGLIIFLLTVCISIVSIISIFFFILTIW